MSAIMAGLGIVLCSIRFVPIVEAWDRGFGYRARPTVRFAPLTEPQKEFVRAYAKAQNLPMNDKMKMRGKGDFVAWHDHVEPYKELLTQPDGWHKCEWLLTNPTPKPKDGWDAFYQWAESFDGLPNYLTGQRKER